MTAYQSIIDLSMAQQMIALAPLEAQAFLGFDPAAERADGAIPPKIQE